VTRKFPRNSLEDLFEGIARLQTRIDSYTNNTNQSLPFRDKDNFPPGIEGQLVLAEYIPPTAVGMCIKCVHTWAEPYEATFGVDLGGSIPKVWLKYTVYVPSLSIAAFTADDTWPMISLLTPDTTVPIGSWTSEIALGSSIGSTDNWWNSYCYSTGEDEPITPLVPDLWMTVEQQVGLLDADWMPVTVDGFPSTHLDKYFDPINYARFGIRNTWHTSSTIWFSKIEVGTAAGTADIASYDSLVDTDLSAFSNILGDVSVADFS